MNLSFDKYKSESIIIHHGFLLKFCCQILRVNPLTEGRTILSVTAFKYHHAYNYFALCDSKPYLKVSIDGQWEIVCTSKVNCDTTKVLQPCVVLRNCSDTKSLSVVGASISLYQLRDFKTWIKLLTTDGLKLKHTVDNINKNKCLILDGPSLMIIDTAESKVWFLKQINDSPILLSNLFPAIVGTPIALKTAKDSVIFLCQTKSNTFNHKDASNFRVKWLDITISFDEPSSQIKVKRNEEFTNVPLVYCSITTSATLWKISTGKDAVLLTTTYRQLVMISDGGINRACDLPLPNCNSVFLVGTEDSSVAIVTDDITKQCCAVNLSSFEVLKRWNTLQYIINGVFLIEEDIVESVVMFYRNLDHNRIEPEDHCIISSLEDVLCEKTEKLPAFNLNDTVELPVDTEYDFFSSPVDSSEKAQGALVKVIESLESCVDKQNSSINDLRHELKMKEKVILTTNQALLKMNNNIRINQEQLEDNECSGWEDGLVDLFTGESFCIESSANHSNNFLELKKNWQRTIYGQWVLGFCLINVSEKRFCEFSLILRSYDSKSPSPSSVLTTHFKVTRLLNENSGRKLDSNISKKHSIECNASTSNDVGSGDEFIVVANTPIPKFSLSPQCHLSYSAALVATLCATTETSSDQNSKTYVFQLGNISLSATSVATGKLSLKLKNFASGINAEICTEELASIKGCHGNQSKFTFSSSTSDVPGICKEILESIGFVFHDLLNQYICHNEGALYLSLVKLDVHSKLRVDVSISCRSHAEESLLLKYVMEQIPHQLDIKPMKM